mmetsp:Transcript_15698/g.36831  ORF Transcript_15698/g.36831 Transcript_15698/m.36831 type:complete len:919 (+) Transcript_15698:78-2834(+)
MGSQCCQQDKESPDANVTDPAQTTPAHELDTAEICISSDLRQSPSVERYPPGNTLPNVNGFQDSVIQALRDETGRKTADLDAVVRKAFETGQRSQQLTPSTGTTSSLSDAGVQLLRKRLEAAGVDTSLYGKGKAKPLELLYHELTVHGSCWLEEGPSGIRRVVEQVQAVVVVAMEGADCCLVSTAQVLHDNRTRNQRQLLLWKLKPGESWEAALETALSVRLLVPSNLHSRIFHICKDSYSYREETEISKGYPGLETTYRFHEVYVRIVDPNAEELEPIGLPEGRDFATMEGVIGTSDVSARLNVWVWQAIGDCARHSLPVDPAKASGAHPKPLTSEKSLDSKVAFQVPVGAQLQLTSISRFTKTPNSVLSALTGGTKTDWSAVTRIATCIRKKDYGLQAFYKDCVTAFPELQLYLGPPEGHEEVVPCSPRGRRHSLVKMTSGNTSDEEYQRTFGALFAVYWLMRLDLNGKDGFCFGVDLDKWNARCDAPKTLSSKPFPQMTKAEKQAAFFANGQWDAFQELFVDAGLLLPSKKKGETLKADLLRTKALMALTAVHDIMKVEKLLPKLCEEHAPFGTYKARETIGDHDLALAYVMEHFPHLLPSFNGLPVEAKRTVLFTQSKMEFNHGWLVQAEGPPGKVLRPFKSVLTSTSGKVTQQDVSFYFVHWLTDLAGAVPTPLAGAEKFVSQFPHAVLASFLNSFPVIKRLATESETQVFEEYLDFRWKSAQCKLPALDSFGGAEVLCMQRLLCMAQHSAGAVLEAFANSPLDMRRELSLEMARTGIKSQAYKLCLGTPMKGIEERWDMGPAFLLYYGPAVLQKSGSDDPIGALRVLNMVCKAGRLLWPLDEALADVTVSLRMDTLKEKPLPELKASITEDEVWLLVRHNDTEGFVERHSKSFLQDPKNCTRPHQVLDIHLA